VYCKVAGLNQSTRWTQIGLTLKLTANETDRISAIDTLQLVAIDEEKAGKF
jgi:hypothetical protein